MVDERIRTESLNNLPPPGAGEVSPPGPYERFFNWAVELPWWAIILALVAVVVGYLMLTSAAYRRVIESLADDPQVRTDDLYDSVLIVGEEITIDGSLESETADTVGTVLSQLLETERGAVLVSETSARITVRTPDGLVSIPKEDIVQDERTADGDQTLIKLTYTESETVTGIITDKSDDKFRIRTVTEEKETFARDRILDRKVIETVPCGLDADPECVPAEIVTIQRQGELLTGTLDTLSNTSIKLDLDQGGLREVRLTDAEYYVVTVLALAANAQAADRTITDGAQVRIGYYEAEGARGFRDPITGTATVDVPLIFSAGETRVELVAYDSLAALLAATSAGEVDGLIYVAFGPELPELAAWMDEHPDAGVTVPLTAVLKSGAAEVKLRDDEITGRVADETEDEITIVTTEAQFVDVDRDTILEERKMKPGVCALNNLAGCDEGIFLTLKVTFYAYGMALLIGLVVGIMRVPSTPTTLLAKLIQTFLTLFSTLYVEVVRGIPLLVILIYAGFVVAPNLRDNPINIPNWSDSILDAVLVVVNLPFQAWNALGIRNIGDLGSFPDPIVIDMPPVTQAVVGLAFGYGAFVAEIFRAGIQSISRGQMEAARSLGMSYPQAMRFVILPQAVRVVLPPLGNDFISMLKDSALISVLALPDLLQLGRLYVSRTFRAFEGYNTVAILYLMMTLFLSMMVRIIERRTRLPR